MNIKDSGNDKTNTDISLLPGLGLYFDAVVVKHGWL